MEHKLIAFNFAVEDEVEFCCFPSFFKEVIINSSQIIEICRADENDTDIIVWYRSPKGNVIERREVLRPDRRDYRYGELTKLLCDVSLATEDSRYATITSKRAYYNPDEVAQRMLDEYKEEYGETDSGPYRLTKEVMKVERVRRFDENG